MLPETDFINRHIGPRKMDVQNMLETMGLNNISELIDKTIPKNIRSSSELDLDSPMSEARYLEHIQQLGRKNKTYRSYIGLGYYNNIFGENIETLFIKGSGWDLISIEEDGFAPLDLNHLIRLVQLNE